MAKDKKGKKAKKIKKTKVSEAVTVDTSNHNSTCKCQWGTAGPCGNCKGKMHKLFMGLVFLWLLIWLASSFLGKKDATDLWWSEVEIEINNDGSDIVVDDTDIADDLVDAVEEIDTVDNNDQ